VNIASNKYGRRARTGFHQTPQRLLFGANPHPLKGSSQSLYTIPDRPTEGLGGASRQVHLLPDFWSDTTTRHYCFHR
jgi:hypothetical protein